MKCTPEEAVAMAEKIFEPDCFNAEEIARLIDLAREPVEKERDALAEQVAKIRAEAMEEAAALCESKIERPAGFGGRFEGYGKFMDSLSGDECAALIRARIPG